MDYYAVCQRGECTSGAFERKALRRNGDAEIREDPIVGGRLGAVSERDPGEGNSAMSVYRALISRHQIRELQASRVET